MPTYTNWWLPSEAEAQLLYDNLKYYGLGNFIIHYTGLLLKIILMEELLI